MVMDINPNDFIDKNLIKTINKLNKFKSKSLLFSIISG
ncbi:unnamed protein product, partial [marine sediment metagenome]